MTLKDKKIAIIIANSGFRDEEYSKPKQIFEQAGAEVITVSSALKLAKGVLGQEAHVDMLISELDVSKFDAVVFVGGAGAKEYWDNPIAHKVAQESIKNNKVLGAICIAPVILANAGVLKGKKATVFPAEINRLKKEGAIYTGNPVESSGNLITACGPEVAVDFGNEIKKALENK